MCSQVKLGPQRRSGFLFCVFCYGAVDSGKLVSCLLVFVSEIFILFHEVTDQYLCQNLWTQLQLLLLKQLEMCFLNYLKSRLFFKDSIFG